ncbi:helix-turn-helix domain-containing protein [Ruegeria sp. EL01]|jgi:transcriptional regulator with XRE-family HTH domain|uniref:helix-turn-helix domain-containing protein n=1 Tax=Ruegeria sp. EL01 TaxID=2107578 RepID=UPI000EA7F974|nr:helix-turn-helix transcriptional regulator [Ruegeria sp. EL01]
MNTGEQLRAARAALKMDQPELASLSGVSVDTIKRLERMQGILQAQMATIKALHDVFVSEGVVFIPENGNAAGVALRKDPAPNIRTRKARGGLND